MLAVYALAAYPGMDHQTGLGGVLLRNAGNEVRCKEVISAFREMHRIPENVFVGVGADSIFIPCRESWKEGGGVVAC